MNRNLILLFCLILVIGGLTIWYDNRAVPKIESAAQDERDFAAIPAPDFTVTAIDGRAVRLSDLQGRIVILHFWATWCPPCVAEFPKIIELAKQMPDDIVLLALSSDRSEKDIRDFLRSRNLKPNGENIHIALDQKRRITHDLYQSFAYPETIIIGRDGTMIRKIAGDADWTSPQMRSYMQDLARPGKSP